MNLLPPGPRGDKMINVTECREHATANLLALRSSQSFGFSLKKAVRLGYVRLSKVLGSDDGKGNYEVQIVKATHLRDKLTA
jgi:hypothetical protein